MSAEGTGGVGEGLEPADALIRLRTTRESRGGYEREKSRHRSDTDGDRVACRRTVRVVVRVRSRQAPPTAGRLRPVWRRDARARRPRPGHRQDSPPDPAAQTVARNPRSAQAPALPPAWGKPYVALDDFSPHKHAEVRSRTADNDAELVFLPAYGSWPNRIAEFTALRHFALNGTDHRTHGDRNAATAACIRRRNAHAEPRAGFAPTHPSAPGAGTRRRRPEEAFTGPAEAGGHASAASTISAGPPSKVAVSTRPCPYACHSPSHSPTSRPSGSPRLISLSAGVEPSGCGLPAYRGVGEGPAGGACVICRRRTRGRSGRQPAAGPVRPCPGRPRRRRTRA